MDLENSNQDIQFSENVVSSNSECKLRLANTSTEAVDCQLNVVEMIELDASQSMRH